MAFLVPARAWGAWAAVLAASAGCAPALDWREVRPVGSSAVLLFPCRPDALDRRVALGGPTLRMDLSACTAGGLTWALAYADVADPARVGPALLALRAAAVANLGGTAAPPQPVGSPGSVRGATPNAASAEMRLAGHRADGAAVQMRALWFAHGTQVFQATVLGPPSAASAAAEAADGFFASIRLGR